MGGIVGKWRQGGGKEDNGNVGDGDNNATNGDKPDEPGKSSSSSVVLGEEKVDEKELSETRRGRFLNGLEDDEYEDPDEVNENENENEKGDEKSHQEDPEKKPIVTIEPEKPIDMVFQLDLCSNMAAILNQIREQLNNSQNVSNEVKRIFLSEKTSVVSKNKVKPKTLNFRPDIHLKELKHQWLRPFQTHLSCDNHSIAYLDLNFHQLTSLKQIKSKYLKQAIIVNASENRIYSLDFISIKNPPPLPSPLPSNQTLEEESKSTQIIPVSSPPIPNLIPTPTLFNQLLYLNVSTNYLFSLYGIQCCPHLKCLDASDNMITSLWPLVHCSSLEYLDLRRNQLTSVLHPNDIVNIRSSQQYQPPSGARILQVDTRPTQLPSSITFLNVSYNSNLSSLVGLESLSKLIHLDASNCSLTSLSPLSGHLYLTYLSLHSNQLSDLHHIFSTLQSLPSITSLHLHPNPFFASLPTPSSTLFSLTSYTIMFLHLYPNQLKELDHLLILPSDYERLHSLLHQINQENLIDLLAASNHEILSNQMINYNKLKSFHQMVERLFENQIKDLQKDQQVTLTDQAEFIRKEIQMLKTVKSVNELYDLEEIQNQREKLIEKGILQQPFKPGMKSLPSQPPSPSHTLSHPDQEESNKTPENTNNEPVKESLSLTSSDPVSNLINPLPLNLETIVESTVTPPPLPSSSTPSLSPSPSKKTPKKLKSPKSSSRNGSSSRYSSTTSGTSTSRTSRSQGRRTNSGTSGSRSRSGSFSSSSSSFSGSNSQSGSDSESSRSSSSLTSPTPHSRQKKPSPSRRPNSK